MDVFLRALNVMLVDQPENQRVLRRIAHGVALRMAEEEDLVQEALVRLWQEETLHPGHSRSWYLQNCAFFLHNIVRHGRSLDSPKRAEARCQPQLGAPPPDSEGEGSSVFEEASADDLRSELCARLSRPDCEILARLAEGWGVRELARRLHLSHAAVLKHRQRIARAALALGIEPPISGPRVMRSCQQAPRRTRRRKVHQDPQADAPG